MPAEDHAHGGGELDIAESEPGRRDEVQGEVAGKKNAACAESSSARRLSLSQMSSCGDDPRNGRAGQPCLESARVR